MQDIGGHVLITARDKDFFAGDFPDIAGVFRTAADGGQIRACLRFGQAHGGECIARGEFGNPVVLLGGVAVFQQCRNRAGDQIADHLQRVVGARENLGHSGGDQRGCVHAAKAFGRCQALPAIARKLRIGCAKAFGHLHAAIDQLCMLLVADGVERGDDAFCEACEMAQNIACKLGVPVINPMGLRHMGERKKNIFGGRFEGCHGRRYFSKTGICTGPRKPKPRQMTASVSGISILGKRSNRIGSITLPTARRATWVPWQKCGPFPKD